MIHKKETTKNKKLTTIVKSVPKVIGEVKFMKNRLEESQTKGEENKTEENKENKNISPIKYSVLTLEDCKTCVNKGGAYIGKVISPLKKEQEVPVCFLLVDSSYKFVVMSLYNINHNIDCLKLGDEVIIRDPNLLYISIKHKKSVLSYP